MTLKYELTDETKNQGILLHRIRALKDFGNVKAGDLGGFIESMDNLSQDGDCWVYEHGQVMEEAVVEGNAKIKGTVKDSAHIMGNSETGPWTFVGSHAVLNNVKLYEKSQVLGSASVSDTVMHGISQINGNSTVCNAALYGHALISDSNVKPAGSDKVHMSDYSYIINADVSAALRMKDNSLIKECTVTKPMNLAGNARIDDESDYVSLDDAADGASAFRSTDGNIYVYVPKQFDEPVEISDFTKKVNSMEDKNQADKYRKAIDTVLDQLNTIQLSADDLNFEQSDIGQTL